MANFVAENIGAEVKLTASEPTKKRYEISLGGERLKIIEEKWLAAARDHAKLPGFRKGHLPAEVILGQMGDWIKERASREVMSSVVEEIVKKESLKLVYNPVIAKIDYKYGDRLAFEAVFEIEPTVTVKNYKGLEVERRQKPVTEDEVTAELERILKQGHPQYLVPVEKAAEADAEEWALVNLTGKIKGETVWSWDGELLSVDSDQAPAGFNNALIGLRPGQKKAWSISLDEDCPTAAWAGQTMSIEMELLDLKRLSGDNGNPLEAHKDEIPKFKEEVRRQIVKRREAVARRHLEEQITADLLRENPMDVPQAEVELRTQELLNRARGLFALSGKELAKEHEGELRVKYAIEAANDIRLGYFMREIARREAVKVNEDDFRKKIESVEDEKERQYYLKHKESVLYDILTEKVFDLLIAGAKITDVEV
ncbi:MAG: trigger factor [Elusimicrobia bacterium]|nr:trigger factor [Elusimicrobiota bacterium]